MAIQYFEKDEVREIIFSDGGWTKATGTDSRIYTSTSATASVTVKFKDTNVPDQEHVNATTGSKVIKNKDGTVELETND